MQNDDVKLLLERIDSIELKLESVARELIDKPNLIFADNEKFLVNSEGFFWEFPKNQINHAISYLNPAFDRGLRAYYYAHLKPASTYIDIGANAGILTSVGAKLVGAKGKVVSIEPIKELQSSIESNIFLNAPTTPYEHFVAAAGESDRVQEFQFFEKDSRVSTMHFDDSDLSDVFSKIQINVLDVRRILPEDPKDTFIKIDAEGNEKEILYAIFNYWGNKQWDNTHVVFEYGNAHLKRAGVNLNDFAKTLSSLDYPVRLINPSSGVFEQKLASDFDHIVDGNYSITDMQQ